MEYQKENPKRAQMPNPFRFIRNEANRTAVLMELQKLPVEIKSKTIILDGVEQTFNRHIHADGKVGGFVGPNARVRDNAYVDSKVVVADEAVVSDHAHLVGNVIIKDFARADHHARVINSKAKPLVLKENIHVTGYTHLHGAAELNE